MTCARDTTLEAQTWWVTGGRVAGVQNAGVSLTLARIERTGSLGGGLQAGQIPMALDTVSVNGESEPLGVLAGHGLTAAVLRGRIRGTRGVEGRAWD